jgi:hypothetical protein
VQEACDAGDKTEYSQLSIEIVAQRNQSARGEKFRCPSKNIKTHEPLKFMGFAKLQQGTHYSMVRLICMQKI